MKRNATLLALLALFVAGCPADKLTPTVAQVRNLLIAVDALPPEKWREEELFNTEEFRELAVFCQQNLPWVAADWEAICRNFPGKLSALRARTGIGIRPKIC